MSKGLDVFGGLSGCKLSSETFELGEGLTLSKTFAHLLAPFMMAFSPPRPEGYHPGPWSAATGGFGFDIHIQLHVPASFSSPFWSDHQELVWWIAALLRLKSAPFLTVPVISDMPFAEIPKQSNKPTLRPFEIIPRMLAPASEESRTLRHADLRWVRNRWLRGGELLIKDSTLRNTFKAFDHAAIRGKTASSLLAIWSGLEQLFSPSPGELRFRVSSAIASFLLPEGKERLALYKRVLKLYDARSSAAHTAADVKPDQLLESYVLMRNALVKIIDEGQVPTQKDLEERMFGVKHS